MKNQNQRWLSKKIIASKPSFNRIQSWIQELQSIENTQRMLLSGGSRKLEGSKLKSQNKKMLKRPFQYNPIQINTEEKVFKISSFQQNEVLSNTFMPFHNKTRIQPKNKTIYSEGISPKQKQQNQMIKTVFTPNQRETFKLNTKQLLFKMKKIKRVQSASSQQRSIYSNKDKISKILNWKAQIFERSKGEQKRMINNQKEHGSWSQKKMKTSPSTPKLKNKQNKGLQLQKIQIEGMFKNKLKKDNQQKQSIKSQKQKNRYSFKEKQKVDPRVRLQLHITKKLYQLEKYNKRTT